MTYSLQGQEDMLCKQGQLTEAGIQQHLALGQSMREVSIRLYIVVDMTFRPGSDEGVSVLFKAFSVQRSKIYSKEHGNRATSYCGTMSLMA